jgi:16S rRNA (uracil1498-N3)-methyltransferase
MFWVFLDATQLQNGTVRISGPTGHHLARVLRVRPGERGVAVASGHEHEIEVTGVEGGQVSGRVITARPIRGEPSIAVTVVQAVLPNPDFDAVIEAGTAVGARCFIAVQAARSLPRPVASRLPRWRSIAAAAAEQSHRGMVPEVLGPLPLKGALDRLDGSRLIVLDPRSTMALTEALDGSPAYALAVGPEGGWSDDELALMASRGGIAVNLGPRILRARLAPVVATAILVQQS